MFLGCDSFKQIKICIRNGILILVMKREEKVIIYNDHFFKMSQTFLYNQVKSLVGKYDVHLLARSCSNPHGFESEEFKKHVISRPGNLLNRAAGKIVRKLYGSTLDIDFRSFLKVRRLLKNKGIKAIHAHFGPRALELLGFARKFNIPIMVTFHGYDASQLLTNREYAEKLPELFDYASGIVIVSGHMVETLKLKPWIEKVHLIPCAVDPAEFMIKNNSRKKDSVLKILHSGRIVGKKGVPDLIHVFRELELKYSNIKLHLAGDGDELESCKKLVAEYGIEEKVTFYGAVSHERLKLF